jgi:hypothetical protein
MGVVAPAVHRRRLDVQNRLPKAFGDELRDAGLAGPAGPGHDGGIGWLTVGDGFEHAREVGDLGATMLNLLGHEPGTENANIADHLSVVAL